MFTTWLNVSLGFFCVGISVLVGTVFYAASSNAVTAHAYQIPERTKKICLIWVTITGLLFAGSMFSALVAIAAKVA